MNDPIVDEVRRYRMEHTRKFDGNLKRICEDLRRLQRDSGRPVVRRPPKRLVSLTGQPVAMDPVVEQERLSHLQQFGKRADWDDPAMDIYDDLDPRRTK